MTPIAQLPHALRPDVAPALLRGRKPVVFLDYDGTLTPIVARPQLAVLDDGAREAVRRLARRLPVAVISGRDRADVEQLVGLDGVIYAGSHGFDIRAPGLGNFSPDLAENIGPLLDQAEAILCRRLDPIPGALVERKRFTIAAHDRLVAPELMPRVEAATREVVAALPALQVKPGKRVFEIQPAVDWDKGKAVLWLLARLGLEGDDRAPLFLGDDVTDEDAFRALAERGPGAGGGIVVADPAHEPKRTSAARARLDTPSQVIRFLNGL